MVECVCYVAGYCSRELLDCDCTVASAVSTASVVSALPNSADNHHQGTPGIILCNPCCFGLLQSIQMVAPVKLNKHIVL